VVADGVREATVTPHAGAVFAQASSSIPDQVPDREATPDEQGVAVRRTQRAAGA
jgi:hypothetical protein